MQMIKVLYETQAGNLDEIDPRSLTGGGTTQPLKWYEYSMCYNDADANDYRNSLAESFRQFADLPIVTQTSASVSASASSGTRSKQTSPSPQGPPPSLST